MRLFDISPGLPNGMSLSTVNPEPPNQRAGTLNFKLGHLILLVASGMGGLIAKQVAISTLRDAPQTCLLESQNGANYHDCLDYQNGKGLMLIVLHIGLAIVVAGITLCAGIDTLNRLTTPRNVIAPSNYTQ